MRITTRLAHSHSSVNTSEQKAQNQIKTPEDSIQYVLLPSNARKRYKKLLASQPSLEEESENSGYNKFVDGKDKSLGIIVSGIAYNYLLENFDGGEIPFPFIKISQYPLPKKMIEKLCDECNEIMVIEEGYPLIEESISGLLGRGIKVRGRFDGSIPRDGELNPNIVAQALGLETLQSNPVSDIIVGRPPSLCDGCPHADTFRAINEAMAEHSKGRNFSDIGCYTLGALPPYQSINSCVDMGASITMAKGAADAGLLPSISVIGDSTFTHSGITGLLDAVNDKSPITIFILDNYTTAMTGGQFSPANGRIEEICKGVGVEAEHIRIIEPLKKNHNDNVRIIKEEVAYNGVSVIIPRRECVVTLTQKSKEKKKAKQ
ncbi:MAG: indolepyruvate ferredoxin oxidoreductase subunit alpha [Ignavibacteriae bacterium]|nr:indolepyruvate ferredoxin oxidoreductase subunit alpha [Ignavibacteriota bacterium]